MYKEYKHLPGWKVEIKEVSNGCFINRAQRFSGNVIEYQGDEDFHRIEQSIIDIEKQINTKYVFFIYEFIGYSFDNELFDIKMENDSNSFGSWYIEYKNKRFVFDGKDSWMIKQIKKGKNWNYQEIYKNLEIDSKTLFEIREWIRE